MIKIYPDVESLSIGAAELFIEQTCLAAKQGPVRVSLAGGETPRRTYEVLAGQPFCRQVPWSALHIYWGDERCVPPQDPRSNEHMARLALLDKVPIPDQQIHPIRCQHDPLRAAADYETLLRTELLKQPPFDLVFLGLGEDGHTASLFPGSPALMEQERWVREVLPEDQGLARITLTSLLLNQAGLIVFLVTGAAKAAVLREVLHGPRDLGRLPAQLIQPVKGNVCWLVDRQAAAMLEK
ncbi:MAG: 6-phosphogluconolactonase [Negativicutes bacterium]|nr:6-phosphogluconolactonase [Negativicutes bacterium]